MYESSDISGGAQSARPERPARPKRSASRCGAAESRRLATQIRRALGAESRWRARVIALIQQFDRKGAYRDYGCETTSEWVSMHCGVSRMAAREYVRVARALRSLPTIDRAFQSGDLTYARVRAVTRFATPETDESLAEVASRTRVEGLEDMARSHRKTRAVLDPMFATRARSVRRWDQNGMRHYLAKVSAEGGSILDQALALVASRAGVSAETDSDESELHPDGAPAWERKRADALIAMARECLAAGSPAPALAAQSQISVYLDASTGMARIDNGPVIGPKTLERLLCDAALSRVMALPGRKLEYGRTRRTVSPAQRAAVIAVYETCQWPGCRARCFLEVHHIQHWSRGGSSGLMNLGLFCWRHHVLGHEGGFEIWIGDDDVLCVRTPSGEVLVGALTRRPSIPSPGTAAPSDAAVVREPAPAYGSSGRVGSRTMRRRAQRESAFGAVPG